MKIAFLLTGPGRMLDQDKTKEELYTELAILRQAINEIKGLEARYDQAMAALKGSEERYRSLVENLGEGLSIVDTQETFIFSNPAAEKTFGVGRGELVGRNLREFTTPEQFKIILAETEKRRRGEKTTYEIVIIRPDQQKRTLLVTATPHFDPQGKFMAALGVFLDITEYKDMEQALVESEVRFRALAETTPVGILIFQGEKFIYANPAAERIGGFSREELLEMDFWQSVHPDYRKLVKERGLARLRGEDVPRHYEFKIITKSGQERWIYVSAGLFPMENSTAGVATFFDITERKQIEEALRESELQYHTIIDSLGDAIYVVDKELRILVMNSAFERWGESLGLAKEMVGKTIFEVFPFLGDAIRQEYARVFTHGEMVVGEERNVFNGNEIFTETRKIPLFEGKTVSRVITVVRDITNRKKAERELKNRIEMEKLITGMSASFINIHTEKIDSAIMLSLKRLAEFSGVDRSYIFKLYLEEKKAENIYEWCAEGISAGINQLKNLSAQSYPWFSGKMLNLETILIPAVSELPLEATAEKQLFQSQDVQSLVIVPMLHGGELIGFLGFDSVRRLTNWSEDVIVLLKIAGEIFANVLEHKRTQKELEKLNKELLKSNRKLKQLALRDSQTGLYNHRYLGEIIEAEFYRARRYATALSVMLLDLDYFKSINDVYGHQFGDLVLFQFAAQLKRMVRRYDIVVRFGGEEFVVISPGTDRSTALMLAQRLQEAIELYNFGNEKHIVKLHASIAVASYPLDRAAKGIDLIMIAEQILSKVKERGGNRVLSSQDIKSQKPAQKARGSEHVKFLKEKIHKLTRRGNQSLTEAVFAFAKTIELKDHYTGEHVEKTVSYATNLAQALALSHEEVEGIRQAAILHDLGKIGVSESILLKKTKLTKSEFIEIKKHPQIGVDIIRPIQFLHNIIPYILYHHERWDGKGYPNGLKEDEIPLGARIIALADAYQALTSKRSYRHAYSKREAAQIIKKGSGTQFDPHVVNKFLKVIGQDSLSPRF